MAGQDVADDAARLEAALARIARAAAQAKTVTVRSQAPEPDTGELARRLDALIHTVRDALAPQ